MLLVYIWGAGYYLQQVVEEIDRINVKILGIIDIDRKKQNKKLLGGIPVIAPSEILDKQYDYIIVSIKKYEMIEDECEKLGIQKERLIEYWKNEYNNFIFKRRCDRVEELIRKTEILKYRLDSAPYEWGMKLTPNIISGEILLKKIINDHSSLCRFGDGEFEMIREKERPWFQTPNSELSKRLKEILFSEDSLINIAVAQNFVDLEKYKDDAADSIREYMFGDTRDFILKLMKKDKIYYDTYVTRPYIIYKDRENANRIFPLFKEIWKNRDVVIIEGKYSRIAVGNDLMKNVHSILRILCPARNAWDRYEIILATVLEKVSKESLICISLGPCATVLAYDLAKQGYQALDIGQIDNEYEWYLREAKERVEIPGKMVAELHKEQDLEMVVGEDYVNQIIAKII